MTNEEERQLADVCADGEGRWLSDKLHSAVNEAVRRGMDAALGCADVAVGVDAMMAEQGGVLGKLLTPAELETVASWSAEVYGRLMPDVAKVMSRRCCIECGAAMLSVSAIASLLEEGATLDDPRPLMLSAVDSLRGWCAKCADQTTRGNYHVKAVKPSAFRCSSCGVGCDGTNVHGNLPVCGSCAVAARSSHLRNNFPPRDNALDCDNCGELHDTFESAAICDRAHKS